VTCLAGDHRPNIRPGCSNLGRDAEIGLLHRLSRLAGAVNHACHRFEMLQSIGETMGLKSHQSGGTISTQDDSKLQTGDKPTRHYEQSQKANVCEIIAYLRTLKSLMRETA
jgi:hypothetical protein